MQIFFSLANEYLHTLLTLNLFDTFLVCVFFFVAKFENVDYFLALI